MHCDKLIKKIWKVVDESIKIALMYLHIILLTSKIAYFGQIHDLVQQGNPRMHCNKLRAKQQQLSKQK